MFRALNAEKELFWITNYLLWCCSLDNAKVTAFRCLVTAFSVMNLPY